MRNRKKNSNATELNRFSSLPWNASSTDRESFDVNIGFNELEGGFLSLEEIEEADFVFDIPRESENKRKRKFKSRNTNDDSTSGVSVVINDVSTENEEITDSDIAISRKKRRKKQKTEKNKKKIKNVDGDDSISMCNESGSAEETDAKEDFVEDPEFLAWNELRLHPLLLKSIHRLGFKDPTPIQKACFPAAAHQGKDVIGAAETGSGKTLAFGLPILQRLLEEREKVERMRDQIGDESQRFAPKGVIRALIVTPTRELAIQVTNHLKEASKGLNIYVVPIVGGISTEKQERLLKLRPEIVVGTPGRLWELISSGEKHLTELHSLSFFVLDEADRMIENGHFQELQNIIDMLPNGVQAEGQTQATIDSNIQRKKRQTFVFSATLSLSADFRKKLKRSSLVNKSSNDLNSIERLSHRAGMKPNASVIDLTSASILAHKLEESFIECREEDKDAYLYYILSIHGQGRVIVFCTSVAALRHLAAILRVLGVNIWTLHAQMQQRARLKAIDRFRSNENGILVATDVAARGIDIPGVRTVIHYQLPHSSEVYVHRSGRTARAFTDGCTIALISPNEISKFASLCKSLSRESFQRFPVEDSYMPQVMKRLSLARQLDKITRKDANEKSKKTWLQRNAQAVELDLDDDDSEDERANVHKRRKQVSKQLDELQQELNTLLSRPLQPNSFSHRYLAGAGVSPMLQNQLQELARQRAEETINEGGNKRRKLVVIGQDCVEPLQALKSSGKEVRMNGRQNGGRSIDSIKRKRKEFKNRLHDQRRKQKKKMKGKM